MSMVVGGLGSTPLRHRKNKKAAMASLSRDIKVLRRAVKAAKKSPAKCKLAARELFNVGYAVGLAYAETKGVYRKKIGTKRPSGVAVKRGMMALRSFEKACLKPRKKSRK